MVSRSLLAFAVVLFACGGAALAACGSGDDVGQDAGGGDAATATDAPSVSHDATPPPSDAARADAPAPVDARADALPSDAAMRDTGATDAGAVDTGAITDTGATDAGTSDAGTGDAASLDATIADASGPDVSAADAATGSDAADGSAGPITGGPCISGASGATAYRIRWIDAGGTAQVQYEVDGLPDKSRDHAGAYGYQIGFTPQFVDPFLGEGGLQLDDSDFVDLEISTVGLSSISGATLSIYGRSYSVDTSGSFDWQTFVDTGATATDFVSNVAPYAWYSAPDFVTAITPGDGMVLIRIKAGPSSDALVVNRIELCMIAQ